MTFKHSTSHGYDRIEKSGTLDDESYNWILGYTQTVAEKLIQGPEPSLKPVFWNVQLNFQMRYNNGGPCVPFLYVF